MRLLYVPLLLVAVFLMLGPSLRAEEALPEVTAAHLKMPLHKIGEGTYRKFGFSVYHATLWATGSSWDPQQPYALELLYTRDVSKDTLVDTTTDDIQGQNVTDDATFQRWKAVLTQALPAVSDGDRMVGVAIPGKKSLLFHNGTELISIEDAKLSKAFFDIWLGDGADASLRQKLLGGSP